MGLTPAALRLRLAAILRRPASRRLVLFFAAFGVGLVASQGKTYLMPFAFFWLPLLRWTGPRWERWLPPFGYFGAFLITMFPGAAIFYGHSFDPFGIFVMWASVALLLSAPWALLADPDPTRLQWAVPFALVASAVPPLGLIDIGNPINATGALLPHTGWFGIAALVVLSGFFATRPRIAIPIALALSFTALLPRPLPPTGWHTVNTQLGGQGLEEPDFKREFATAQFIQQTALQSRARVIVFPESVVTWNDSTELFWQRTIDTLKRRGQTLVLGATVKMPGFHSGYRNTVVLRGATSTIYDQRIPIPVTMWHPLTDDGVPLRMDGPGVLAPIHGVTAAPLVCYEQLLPWPIMLSEAKHPTLLLGMANDYWAKGTYFPAIQNANLDSWSRLFNTPYISAVNQ